MIRSGRRGVFGGSRKKQRRERALDAEPGRKTAAEATTSVHESGTGQNECP
jgi:hypothetical protein